MADLPVLGEPLAIELANTVVGADDGELDLLVSAEAVDAWIRAHDDQLPAGALEGQPSEESLRRLRDAVRELVAAAMERRSPVPASLRHVNAVSRAAAPRPVLVWSEGGPPAVEVVPGQHPAKATLATIAQSAVELLGGPGRGRLRRCERAGCVLLFVATNPRRRWCSAAVCGNRARVARHYQRHHSPTAG